MKNLVQKYGLLLVMSSLIAVQPLHGRSVLDAFMGSEPTQEEIWDRMNQTSVSETIGDAARSAGSFVSQAASDGWQATKNATNYVARVVGADEVGARISKAYQTAKKTVADWIQSWQERGLSNQEIVAETQDVVEQVEDGIQPDLSRDEIQEMFKAGQMKVQDNPSLMQRLNNLKQRVVDLFKRQGSATSNSSDRASTTGVSDRNKPTDHSTKNQSEEQARQNTSNDRMNRTEQRRGTGSAEGEPSHFMTMETRV